MGSYRFASIMTPVFTMLEVVMGVLIPYVTSWIIDRGIMENDMPDVYRYGALMLVLALLSLFFGIMAGRFSAVASSGLASNLRSAMFRNVQQFSFADIDRFGSAGLVTRMTTDVSNIQNAYQMLLRVSVRAPLNLLFSIVMCVFISPRLSLVFVAALAVLGVVLWLVIGRAVKLFSQVFKRYDDLNNVVQENVTAIRVVKAFVREDYESLKFSKATMALYRLFVRSERLMAINHPVMMLVVYGCIISLSWWGAQFVVAGNLTTGQLTSLFAYVMTILSALMMLSMVFVMLTMSAASGRRIAEVINAAPSIVSPDNALHDVADGSVDFSSVDFSYKGEGGELAVSGIDFHISSGETIGVIGGTGCGKSTLATLISRMYDATHGTVSVGGNDVKRYDLKALRSAVAVVLQQNQLFSGTVLDNLRWGDENATLQDCKWACDIAQASEFVDAMPDGYFTLLEQGGVNVSGGQKQRLCIARALLRRPKVLILDDSTSACDTATAAAITKALDEKTSGMTTIIIAQRVQSVENAQRIIVMDKGRVVDFAPHAALMERCAIYREIYMSQTQINGDFDKPKAEAD